MKPITLGVMGAMSSLVALPPASADAQTRATPQPQSYADLLEPIPNASEKLKVADADNAQDQARLIPTAYHYRWVRERVYYRRYYRRHVFYRRYRRHYYYGYGYYVAPLWPYYYPHHHHHHHHHSFY